MYAGVAISSYIPIEHRMKEAELMFEMTFKMMEKEKDENTKKILLAYLISMSLSHKNKQMLLEWLQKGVAIPGYELQRVNLI